MSFFMEVKMKKFAAFLVAVMLFGFVIPVQSQADRIEVNSYEYDCFTGLEKAWGDGGQVMHLRNVRHTNIDVSNSPYLDGINTTVADAEINLKTGSMIIRGTTSLKPHTIDGTWEGTWVSINNQGVVKTQAVAHGTGALSGKTLFLTIYDAPYNPETESMCAGIGDPEGNVITEGYILETSRP